MDLRTLPYAFSSIMALCLAGCGPSWSAWVNLDAIGPSFGPRKSGAEAVRAQAAIDLGCQSAGLAVREIRKDEAFRVAGCGHTATYVGVQAGGLTKREPSHPDDTVQVSLRRFFLVSEGDITAALTQFDRQAAPLGLVSSWGDPVVPSKDVSPTVLVWVDLSRAAERDLPCPRASIHLDVVQNLRAPSTFIAEGCGVRGLFVRDSTGALVITSRVAVSPPAAR